MKKRLLDQISRELCRWLYDNVEHRKTSSLHDLNIKIGGFDFCFDVLDVRRTDYIRVDWVELKHITGRNPKHDEQYSRLTAWINKELENIKYF